MPLSSATLIIVFLWASCVGLIVRNVQLKRRIRRYEKRERETPPVVQPPPTKSAEPRERTILRDRLGLDRGILPAGGDWRAGDDLLLRVVDWIDRNDPSVIVELGSGLSTAVIAQALACHGSGHLYTLEHDPTFAEDTEDLLRKMKLNEQVDLIEAPLVDYGNEGKWYEQEALDRLPSNIDLLFIDGPPHFAGKAPRFPAGPELFNRISDSGVVFLDDGHRNKEQKVLRMWARDFPEFEQIETGTRKQAVMLRRIVRDT